jgi:hypothetical protein
MKESIPMSRALAIAAVLVLAGCGPAAETENLNKPPATIGTARDAAEAEKIHEERALAADFGWQGRFAASAELCTGGVWDIGRTRIVTDGETACDVRGIESGAGRVVLALSCTAEGMASEESWTLTPRDSGGIRVVRAPKVEAMSAVDLVRCG